MITFEQIEKANGKLTTVQLGTGENMQEKLFLMADMLPELAGREGTLYLDNYREGSGGSGYIFK